MNAKIFPILIILLLTFGVFSSVGIQFDNDIELSTNSATNSNLPDIFDWRKPDKNYKNRDCTTPIKSQGGCGSCWAFATVGVLESAILIEDNIETNLSEQYLVSCNRHGFGCNGGNYHAHDYHQWKEGKDFNGVGAVYEDENQNGFPYWGYEIDWQPYAPLDHVYRINSYSCAGFEGAFVPSINSIKQAIYDHGPVYASVYAGTAFQSYDGGIFTTHEDGGFLDPTNHAVILVGWDDNQGPEGVWFLRNSWGTDWGEDKYGNSWDENDDGIQDHEGGYMRIAYGTSSVGWVANYIDYGGSGQGEFRIDVLMENITNDPDSEHGPFEPIDWPESNNPEWYYSVNVSSIVHKTFNRNFGHPLSSWVHSYSWSPNQLDVYFLEDVIVDIEIQLWDCDYEFGWYNDQADITKKSDRTFKGYYNLQDDELFYSDGEKINKDSEDYYVIKGNYNPDDDKCDNARVRFKIEDHCHIQPDLETEDDSLSWSNVEPNSTKTTTINIRNDGDAKSLLDWQVESKPDWVSVDPSDGIDLKPSDGDKSLEISVEAPGQGEPSRTGEIRIVNTKNSNDFEVIDVSIALSSSPNVPDFVDPPSEGRIDKHILFEVVTEDPDGDRVAYWFNWGDGKNSGWVDSAGNYYESGTTAGCTHIWTSTGTFDVKVKAKDIKGVESGYSDTVSIVIEAIPDLSCSGRLNWDDVTVGDTVRGSFSVENVGDHNSELDWDITSWPSWGTNWNFDYTDGKDNNLTPGDGEVVVYVSFNAPDGWSNRNEDFDGTVIVKNTHDSSDKEEIDVDLTTSLSKSKSSFISRFGFFDLLNILIQNNFKLDMFSKLVDFL